MQLLWKNLIVVSLFVFSTAFGAEGSLSNTEVVQYLRADKFGPLEDYFGNLQRRYSEAKIPEETVRDACRAFYDISPDLEAHYSLWIRQYPKSYVARLARAIYYKKIGLESRGDKSISETSAERIRGMRDMYAKALKDLEVSYTLDRRPLLSYGHALDIGMYIGSKGERRRLLDSGLKLDPRSQILRSKYMVGLETRWGGSLEEMVKFLEESRRAGTSTTAMRELEGLVEEERGWLANWQDRNPAAAANHYARAAQLTSYEGCSVCGPAMQAAAAYVKSEQYVGAEEMYTKILAKNPNEPTVLSARGYVYYRMNKGDEAVRDYKRAAELGDAYAMDQLARLYLSGTFVPENRDTAIAYLRKAVAHGQESSKELLQMAEDKSLELVPIDPRDK